MPSQEQLDKYLPQELDSPTAQRLNVLFQQHKYYGDEDAVHQHQMPHAGASAHIPPMINAALPVRSCPHVALLQETQW